MDGMTGGMMGGLGVDPMARFLPTQSAAPMANASNMGSQAAMMRLTSPQPGLLSQVGQAAGKFGDAYSAIQGAMPQQQMLQAPGLAQAMGGQMPMEQQAMQQQSPMSGYLALLDQVIAGAFD